MNAPLPAAAAARRATVQRDTKETRIRVSVDLDGTRPGANFRRHRLLRPMLERSPGMA